MNAGRVIVVDINVWLDVYLPERPHKKESLRFIEGAVESGVPLAYPVHIVKDVFYMVDAELKRMIRRDVGELPQGDSAAIRRMAWGCVDNMRELATSVGCNEGDVWLASKWRSTNGDLEDNLVRAAVERAKADLLVTWDKGLLAKAFVPTVTPVDALAQIRTWAA